MALSTQEFWQNFYLQKGDCASNEWYFGEDAVLEALADVLPETGSVLHIGCGTSVVGVELSRRGYSVTNVDYSPAAISCMQSRYPEETFMLMDCRKMSFEDASFDVLLDKGTVDSMTAASSSREENAAALIQECARVLRPGGLCFVFSSYGPDEEKDMMMLLRAPHCDLKCRIIDFAPFEYPDQTFSYVYTLEKLPSSTTDDFEIDRDATVIDIENTS